MLCASALKLQPTKNGNHEEREDREGYFLPQIPTAWFNYLPKAQSLEPIAIGALRLCAKIPIHEGHEEHKD